MHTYFAIKQLGVRETSNIHVHYKHISYGVLRMAANCTIYTYRQTYRHTDIHTAVIIIGTYCTNSSRDSLHHGT